MKKKKGPGRPKTPLRAQSLWNQRVYRARKLERSLQDRLARGGADGASLLDGSQGPGSLKIIFFSFFASGTSRTTSSFQRATLRVEWRREEAVVDGEARGGVLVF